MFSVRITTRWHGNTQFEMMWVAVLITAVAAWQWGADYLVIFAGSALVHLIIELGLAASGIRKGKVQLYGREVPRLTDSTIRAMLEGPAFCVPAFFVADRVAAGETLQGVVGAGVLVAVASTYMGMADKRHLAQLEPGEEPILSRRAMTRPGAVMLLSLFNTGSLFALFSIPAPYRAHAFTYIAAYGLLVMLFYLINYNLGVRLVELRDEETGAWTRPGPAFQAAALTYDSVYEMGLMVSPAYWGAFYLGLFSYGTLG